MNDTEQLIKEALGQLAERTPHPGPTLNALRRKRKRQRNNIFLIATAGMAAVVVLIFAGVIASDRYTPPNANDAAAALVPGGGGSLKYQPHWLPEGYVEISRITSDPILREWAPPGSRGPVAMPSITLSASLGMPDAAGRDEVIVRGLKAWVQVNGQSADVVWRAQDILTVTVRGMDDVRAVALRVADSVRADARITHQSAFKLEGKYADRMGGTTPAEWDATLKRGSATVHVSPQKPDLSGLTEPVTVRGKEGMRSAQTVLVFDGGRWIWASASEPSDLPVELVNKVELVDSPDTNWIGKGL